MNGLDPATLAAVTVIAFGAGAFLVALREPARKWVYAHARRSFGDVLGVGLIVLAYVSFAVYGAAKGNAILIVLLAAAILGALSIPAIGLLMPRAKPSRSASKSQATADATDNGYIRLLFGFVLLLVAGFGLLLLILVEFRVNPLIAIASVILIGTTAVTAVVATVSMDLRRRGALSEARTVDIIKATLLFMSRLVPTDLFRQLRR